MPADTALSYKGGMRRPLTLKGGLSLVRAVFALPSGAIELWD